jgi:hypothetical protein
VKCTYQTKTRTDALLLHLLIKLKTSPRSEQLHKGPPKPYPVQIPYYVRSLHLLTDFIQLYAATGLRRSDRNTPYSTLNNLLGYTPYPIHTTIWYSAYVVFNHVDSEYLNKSTLRVLETARGISWQSEESLIHRVI